MSRQRIIDRFGYAGTAVAIIAALLLFCVLLLAVWSDVFNIDLRILTKVLAATAITLVGVGFGLLSVAWFMEWRSR